MVTHQFFDGSQLPYLYVCLIESGIEKTQNNLSASCDHFVTYKITTETLDH